MKHIITVFLSLILSSALIAAEGEKENSKKETMDQVVLVTNKGEITIQLAPKEAPITVKNFLEYVDSGFYDGLIFHRVIPGFMIQGGGFMPEMVKKNPEAPITNESSNGLGNDRGTLSMARTNDPDSATSQFFINVVDSTFLNAKGNQPGYAVFGKVVEGMEVVDAIAKVKTTRSGFYRDVPADDVIIERAFSQ